MALSGMAGAAWATPTVDPPRPLPSGAQLSVHPGDRVEISTEARSSADTRNGARVLSGAFKEGGILRMDDRLVVAVMTISCAAAPGSYEVRLAAPAGEAAAASDVGRLWGNVQVAQADEPTRAECERRVAALPPQSQEENWGADAPWPQTPWHVTSVRAGGELTAHDNSQLAGEGDVRLSSPGFTGTVVMHGDKAVTATARIRCDAQPGLYVVQRAEGGKPAQVWARYRVTPPDAGCHDPAPQAQVHRTMPSNSRIIGAASALAVAGAGIYVWLRIHRRATR
ncbi:hypothetical protein ABT084_34360 [Streptomyces sp. NPDC002138]|uniref:hypothetical protein n=1 Tax=Streptomyces sp. NPDC002138 TaxID=3154410 RepID=UPI0033233A62